MSSVSGGPSGPGRAYLLGTYDFAAGAGRLEFSPTRVNDWRNNQNDTQTTTIDFDAFHTSAAGTLGIRSVGISVTSFNDNNPTIDDAVTLRVLICSNTTATCSSSSFFDQLYTVTANGLNTFAGMTFSSEQFNDMSIRLIASISDGDSPLVRLDSFYLEFQDNPEPSTFAMLGSALVAIGLLARRLRRA